MENNKMKKPIPVELDDDVLDNVSGGTGGIDELKFLSFRKKTKSKAGRNATKRLP